jgi:beta-lactamase class C
MGNRPDILSDDLRRILYTPLVRTQRELRRYRWGGRVRSTHYALGWRVFDYSGHTLVYHSGGVQGYLAQMGFLPEFNVGIVVLQNSRRIDFFIPTFFDRVLELYGVH